MPKIVSTTDAPTPVGPYNQAVKAGNFTFVSGQIAIDPKTNRLIPSTDVADQTERVMQNLQAVLQASGATFANVVKTTIYLADMGDFAKVNEIYGRSFDEDNAPARATVEVSRLPKDVRVEIECVAFLE